MAVAVKNQPDVASSTLLDRLPAQSLLGTVYVLGCIGIVFHLIPSLWWMSFDRGSFVAMVFLGVVMLAAAAGLVVGGVRVFGPRAVQGVRAGIFCGLVGFLLVLLLTRWVSMWIEHWVYNDGLFGDNGPMIGAIVTGVAGMLMLFLLVRRFFRPSFERMLVRFEGQGWFSAKGYKQLQGLRVRRGTIFGILVLVGAGIYTLLSHGTLTHGPADWDLNIPFTGKVVIAEVRQEKNTDYVVSYANDAASVLDKEFPGWDKPELGKPFVIPRFKMKEINAQVDPGQFLKIYDTGSSSAFHVGQIVPRAAFNKEVEDLKEQHLTPPIGRDPVPAGGPTLYATLTLLPSLALTVPLLLLAVALWLAWRIVNMPAFADFLIATEAELNKVSWTTQRRLVQDTIVVLITVLLMAGFLFLMDQGWRVLLSWKPIGVLQLQEEQQDTTPPENRPW
jgi:preprotein translocase SecE subunit